MNMCIDSDCYILIGWTTSFVLLGNIIFRLATRLIVFFTFLHYRLPLLRVHRLRILPMLWIDTGPLVLYCSSDCPLPFQHFRGHTQSSVGYPPAPEKPALYSLQIRISTNSSTSQQTFFFLLFYVKTTRRISVLNGVEIRSKQFAVVLCLETYERVCLCFFPSVAVPKCKIVIKRHTGVLRHLAVNKKLKAPQAKIQAFFSATRFRFNSRGVIPPASSNQHCCT